MRRIHVLNPKRLRCREIRVFRRHAASEKVINQRVQTNDVVELTPRETLYRTEDRIIRLVAKHDVLIHAHDFKHARRLIEQQKGTKVHFGWYRIDAESYKKIAKEARLREGQRPRYHQFTSMIRGLANETANYFPNETDEMDLENADTYPAIALISNEKIKETEYNKIQSQNVDQENVVGVVTLTRNELEKIIKRAPGGAFLQRRLFAAALYVKAAKLLKTLSGEKKGIEKLTRANGFHLNPNREVYKTPNA